MNGKGSRNRTRDPERFRRNWDEVFAQRCGFCGAQDALRSFVDEDGRKAIACKDCMLWGTR